MPGKFSVVEGSYWNDSMHDKDFSLEGLNNSIWDVFKDVKLFRAQARIPPGLRKDLPKGGVVLLFPRSLLRCFVVSSFRRSLCRGVIVLPMGCTTSRRRNLLKSIKNLSKIYQNPSQMGPKSIPN